MDGTCEQFFSRFLFSAAANFQKREYAEHEDRHSHIATVTMLSRGLRLGDRQRTIEMFPIGRAPTPEKAHFAFGAQRERKILQCCRLINS